MVILYLKKIICYVNVIDLLEKVSIKKRQSLKVKLSTLAFSLLVT
jgi:hypothetical protein